MPTLSHRHQSCHLVVIISCEFPRFPDITNNINAVICFPTKWLLASTEAHNSTTKVRINEERTKQMNLFCSTFTHDLCMFQLAKEHIITDDMYVMVTQTVANGQVKAMVLHTKSIGFTD